MAAKTFYILSSIAVGPNYWGNLQEDGGAPPQAQSSWGFAPGQTPLSTPYFQGFIGGYTQSNYAQATSWIASSTGPGYHGGGFPITGYADSYSSPTPQWGAFAAGNWTLSCGLGIGYCTGRLNCRIWASKNADSSNARELTSGLVSGSTIGTAGSIVNLVSIITWSAPAITLSGEYLFFQFEWQETTLGTSSSATVLWLAGSTFTTPNFVPAVYGLLGVIQASQTVVAAGKVTVAGAANIAQAPQSLVGTIGNITTGQANIAQANQGMMGWANVTNSPAAQVIWYLPAAAVAPNWFGQMQVNGSAPSLVTPTFGWNVSTTPMTTPYFRGYQGAAAFNTTGSATPWNANTTGPTAGTGSGVTAPAAGDSFVAGPFTGTFANATWTHNIVLRTTGNRPGGGHINVQMWKSANASGAGATLLMPNTPSLSGSYSPSTPANVSFAWSPGATITLNNEYLFLQIEWQSTAVAQGTPFAVVFNIGQCNVTTPVYVTPLPPVGCTLNQAQSQTLTATGFVPLSNGTLQVSQFPHMLTAFGLTTAINGGLTELQDSQTILAKSGPVSGLALGLTQADQTFTGRAYAAAMAALNLIQADHMMVGKGSGGVVQDSHSLAAKASVLVLGDLDSVQADQAFVGRAGLIAIGALNRLQGDQTLVSYSGPIVDGKLIDILPGTRAGGIVLQVDQTLTATCWVVVGAKLNLIQQSQTSDLVGFVKPFVELAGNLSVALPFSTPPLTEWQELATTGITITQTMTADMNVKAVLPLVGVITPVVLLGATGMTTTPSTDLPTLGISTVAALGPSNLTVTPAVSLTTTALSATFSLSATLSTFDPTSAIIIDCGTF